MLADEALRLALRSEQEPAGVVALVIAAGVLVARGDGRAARELLAYVREHRATPFEALRMAERLEAGGSAGRPVGAAAPAADGAPSRLSLAATIEAVLEWL